MVTHYKGTSKKEFEKVLLGENVVWRIDMSRAATIEEMFFEKFDTKTAKKLISVTKKIMITAPQGENPFSRVKEREGSAMDFKEFEKRLKKDIYILNKFKHKFPYVIENNFGQTQESLKGILKIIEE